ncbi:MAG: ATP-binding protein [Armatimonadota bacterium]
MIKERKIFAKLLKEASVPKVSIILGSRQVGKTTALEYVFETICGKGKHKGIFLDLDIYSNFEKISSYENAVNTFKLAGYNPESRERFYVFLDEFQRYKDLTVIIKNIYDHHKNIKIYATGSSSITIKCNVQESLSGRKIITYLFPLNFEEFLIFKNKKDLLAALKNVSSLRGEDLFAPSKELFENLEEFIRFGAYPEVVLAGNKKDKTEILRSIFDLYVKKELVEYLKIEKIYETKRLIQYLAVNNAQKIKYQNISQFVGFSQKTVKHYIEIIKETFLLVEIKPFFANKNKELVKIPKIYFVDTGVANFFTNNFNKLELRNDSPFLFENFVLSEFLKNGFIEDNIKFWQDKNKNEVDFILEKSSKVTAVEVKFKKNLKASDFSSLNLFKKDYPGTDCVLINLSSQKKHKNIKTMLPYKAAYAAEI